MQRTNKVLRKPWIIVLGVIFIAVLLASRLINLEKTSRFIWDESSDLVNIHEIYVDHKLTLVGPISEDGSKVFGSLTYYMLLPFAIAGNFDPVSTAYGAAFWGILTGCLLTFLAWKINKKSLIFITPTILFWYPLVETGRWAWNPNLIPFFTVLAIIFSLQKKNIFKFLAGLSIGLSIHLHYLAIFSALGFGIAVLYESIKQKKIANFLYFAAGAVLAILPFVFFDLTHPPGLFLSRILYFNNMSGGSDTLSNLWRVLQGSFVYFTQSNVLAILLAASLAGLIFFDVKNKSGAIKYLLIFLLQIAGLIFVANYYTHYILPALVFFIVYLIFPRKGISKIISYCALSIILISGIISFPKQITKVTWESDIASTRFITKLIMSEIQENNLKNNNLVVLESPDTNTYGRRYRDLLLIKNVNLLTKGEYDISDHLFVVSEASADKVRVDPAYEMRNFKGGTLLKSWEVPSSPWRVYLFSR